MARAMTVALGGGVAKHRIGENFPRAPRVWLEILAIASQKGPPLQSDRSVISRADATPTLWAVEPTLAKCSSSF